MPVTINVKPRSQIPVNVENIRFSIKDVHGKKIDLPEKVELMKEGEFMDVKVETLKESDLTEQNHRKQKNK